MAEIGVVAGRRNPLLGILRQRQQFVVGFRSADRKQRKNTN
ncbi:hypothetical protein MJC1_01103 [Methylocystis sp. MJC1]|nr:hypothetical protein MJC1_01103 [Methylocystis sp. MJC1]